MTGDTEEEREGGREAEATVKPGSDEPWRDLLRMCKEELERTAEPGRAARLLHTAGRLYEERLGDARRAADNYLEAFRFMPGYLPNLRAARRLMGSRSEWPIVLEILDSELHVTGQADQKAELYVDRGRILEERLGATERGQQSYARAVELDARNPDAWRLLARSLRAGRRWQELDDLLLRVASNLTDPKARAALVVRRARLHDEQLEDPSVAAQLFEDALDHETAPPGAIMAVKRLHEQAGRWSDLIRILTREAELVEENSKALVHYRIARVYAERLGRKDRALEHLEQVERLEPRSVLALYELANLYEEAGRHHDLVRVSLRLLDLTGDEAERLALHQKIGLICEDHLNDDERALEHFRAAVELRPTFVPALQALGKLCRKHDRFEQLLEMHVIEAEQAPDAERRALAHYRAGEVLESQLERYEAAVEHYQRSIRVVPSFLPALRALDRLYTRLGRWKDLIALYEAEGERFRGRANPEGVGEDGLRLARIEQIGSVYEEKIGDLDQAAESFRRILEIDPTHVGAMTALERIYEKGERWTELMEILEREAELVEDESWVVALLHKIGEIAEERLGDRELALLHFRRALAISPSYVPALTSLGRTYYQQGRWVDLLGMYRKESEVASRVEDRAPILFKMGEIYEQKEAKEEDAEACYRQCLELDHAFSPALRALERLYRRHREWGKLAEILEAQASELRDPLARAVAYNRVGALWEERLGKEQLAWDAYTHALECSPTFAPARDALARLCAGRGAWQDLAEIYEEQLASSACSGYQRIELLTQLAWLREGRLGSPETAIEAYVETLEAEPGDLGAQLSLVELYHTEGQWEELAECYRRLAESAGDYVLRLGALRGRGLTLQDRLASADEAAAVWEQILDLRPTDALALRALEASARAVGDKDAMMRVIRLQIERASDPHVDAALRMTLVDLLESTGNAMDALAELRKVLHLEPELLPALEGLRRIGHELGDRSAEIEALRQLAEIAGEPERKARMLVQAATLMKEIGAGTEDAVAALERALEVFPDSVEAAEALERTLTADSELDRLKGQLLRAAGRGHDLERMSDLYRKVAIIELDALHDLAGAVAALEKARKLAPEDIDILDALAELYPELGRFDDALGVGEKLLEVAEAPELRDKATLRLAEVLAEHFGEPERAVDQLSTVLEKSPDSVDALRALAAVRLAQKEWNEAIVVLERLAKAEEEPERRSKALVDLARALALGMGETDRVIELLSDALSLRCDVERAFEVLKEAFDRATEVRALVAAYERILGELKTKGSGVDTLNAIELDLAILRADALEEHDDAARHLRTILDRSPGHAAARARLAALYTGDEEHAEDAIREHRALLESDPFRLESGRDLAELWAQVGKTDRATCARAYIAFFESTADSSKGTTLPRLHRPVGRSGLRPRLASGAFPAHAVALLEALEPHLSKLYPPDLGSYGVLPKDVIPRNSGTSLRRTAEQAAELFEIEEFDLYVHSSKARGPGVEMSEPPALLVPEAVNDLPEAEQEYVLAELISRLALGTWPALKVRPGELEVLMAAAARMHVSGFGSGTTSDEDLDDQRRRLEKAMPKRVRKGLVDVAHAYAEGPPVDFAEWMKAMDDAAARAGLLACGDLGAAIAQVRKRDEDRGEIPAITPEEKAAILGESDAAKDLLRWFLSDDHFILRLMAGEGG